MNVTETRKRVLPVAPIAAVAVVAFVAGVFAASVVERVAAHWDRQAQ